MTIKNTTPHEIKVMLASIEKFGPYQYNVAERISQKLNNKKIKIGNNIISIISVKIPINYSTFRTILADNIEKEQPQICIGLGMDFKDLDHLSFELVARRRAKYGEEIRDINGSIGFNNNLDNGINKIRIPNETKIVKEISKIQGIKVSEDAGNHMCETILRDLIRLSHNGENFQAGFIHVVHTLDLLKDSIKLTEHKKSMPLETQKDIIEKVIKGMARFYL